jgi:pimeloyl-ACP methyl ester carboxylesterase
MITRELVRHNKKISYTLFGQGEPVLFIHGFAEDGDIWKYQRGGLSEKYQLIIPDLPGSGRSELAGTPGIDTMADDMKAIFDAENIQKAVVMGHSMGGYITLAFAEKYPEMLQAFGLVHSTAYADNDEKKAARQRGIEFIRKYGSEAFLNQSVPNLFSENYRINHAGIIKDMIEQYRDFNPAALTAYYEAMIRRPDRTRILTSFPRPVLFITGKQDKAVPFEQSLQQCGLPQLSYIHVLDESAHMGMWEEAEKTNEALISFLDDVYVK